MAAILIHKDDHKADPGVAFQFQLTTDEIREKMFEYLKPIYKKQFDPFVDDINWTTGVYDKASGLFLTFVSRNDSYEKYIAICESGSTFHVVVNRQAYSIVELSEEYESFRDLLLEGIQYINRFYDRELFNASLSSEQIKALDDIKEKMKDRCRPSVEIRSYEDAVRLFYQEQLNEEYIHDFYNKVTTSSFDQYLPEEKRRAVRGERYRELLTGILECTMPSNEEEGRKMIDLYSQPVHLLRYPVRPIDEPYVELTLQVMKKGVLSSFCRGYAVVFLETYLLNCLRFFPDRIQSLRLILDFLNDNQEISLPFCKNELEKRIYNQTEGFHFICLTDEIREKIFDYLKPKYNGINSANIRSIDWKTGVYDRESGIFLTSIYHYADPFANEIVQYHTYIVIKDTVRGFGSRIFTVEYNYNSDRKTYEFKIPDQRKALTDTILEGIKYYDRHCYEFRKLLREEDAEILEKAADAMRDRCHPGYVITCEADAQKLYEIEYFDIHKILDRYNKKTQQDFCQYISMEKAVIWRDSKISRLLNEVKRRIISDKELCRYFSDGSWHVARSYSQTDSEHFLKTVIYMYRKDLMADYMESALQRYIESFMKEHPDRSRNLVLLTRYIGAHAKSKKLKDAAAKVHWTK